MGETNQIVDHLRLEYQGVFEARAMFNMFTKWLQESPYEKGQDNVSEQNTSHGKCIEYTYYPWIKETAEVRNFLKIRILIYDLKKVDTMVDGKKKRLDHAKVILYLDGFLEYDYEHRWHEKPLFLFFRTLYIKFFYKNYSKFYEKKIIDDCYALYHAFEAFFNMYKYARPIGAVPHFYY
jgi:hypothetical protein